MNGNDMAKKRRGEYKVDKVNKLVISFLKRTKFTLQT
jgi:hypothetical protein